MASSASSPSLSSTIAGTKPFTFERKDFEAFISISIKEKLICPVTLELLTEALTSYPCGHTFQESAASILWVKKNVCPYCRKEIIKYVSNEFIRAVARTALLYESKQDHEVFAQVPYPFRATHFKVSEDTLTDSNSGWIYFLDKDFFSIIGSFSICYYQDDVKKPRFKISFDKTSDCIAFLEYAKKTMPTFKPLIDDEIAPKDIISYDTSKSSEQNLQSAKDLFKLIAANNFFPEGYQAKIEEILETAK